MRIVVALGGNAMTAPNGRALVKDQQAAITVAAEPIADLVAAGHEVLLTHGNGPQVGNLLVKNEITANVVPPVPLDWCGAQTQATVGVTLMNALDAALAARGIDKRTIALVSRTLVDADDPGFRSPSKPIGRCLSKTEAGMMSAHGQKFTEVPDKGWRRVVPSPEPLSCLDGAAAETLLEAGFLVVCSGGGGIPTVRAADGRFAGVEAVIDKDLTAALIGREVGADVLVIATDVEAAVADWGTPQARPIGSISAAGMRALSVEQNFAAGSMGPKVEAVTRFAEETGRAGIITSLTYIAQAVEGLVGTRVTAA